MYSGLCWSLLGMEGEVGSLACEIEERSRDIERIQKRAMKIICPGKTYELVLIECGIKTLENR
jgi:hypothetical protein